MRCGLRTIGEPQMGWAGGSAIAIDIVEVISELVEDSSVKREIYEKLIDSLEEQDWDTQEEALGIDPVFDRLLKFRMSQ